MVAAFKAKQLNKNITIMIITRLVILCTIVIFRYYRCCGYTMHSTASIYVFNNIIKHYEHDRGMTMARYCEMSLYVAISKPVMYISTTNVRRFIGCNQQQFWSYVIS